MYSIPEENLQFIILCPERNWGGLMCTSKSIKECFPSSKSIAVVGDDATDAEFKEFNTEVKTIRGGKTISGLINAGLNHSKNTDTWNFILMAGNYIRYRIIKKYFRFVESNTDVVYPVVTMAAKADGMGRRCWEFPDASINGLLLHKKLFSAVGDFDEAIENFSHIKMFWALDAIKEGAKFKAIVGTRL